MRESPSSEVSLHGGLVKAADPHLDPHEETSGRKQWKHGCERVFQSQRKRSKTSGKRYFQNFSTLCNQQVGGSSPSTSSNPFSKQRTEYGGIPEWPKGADCKSVVSDFGGSNPPSPTKVFLICIKNTFIFYPNAFSFLIFLGLFQEIIANGQKTCYNYHNDWLRWFYVCFL